MRKASQFLPLVFGSLLFSGCGGGPPDALAPSLATVPSGCSVTFTYIGSKVLTVPANSRNNDAGWFINNAGTTTVTITGQTVSKSGSVTAVRPINWATFPFTMDVGERIDADLFFDVGASGTGGVGMGISTSCGAKTLPAHVVSIQAGGVPFGPSDLFLNSTTLRQSSPFSFTTDGVAPADVGTQINTARINHIKYALVMTGGSHDNYITDGHFDFTKWKTRQELFNTQAIRDAVAAGVGDGTVPFAVLMDEPNHSSWGGVMTHALLDSMSRYTKNIFPTLRTGVDVTHTWQPTSVYQSVDVITTQYVSRLGDVVTWRNAAVSSAATQKVALFFSINILNGGTDLRSSGCPVPQTGGLGTTEDGVLKGCRMTAAQVETFGNTLLGEPSACGLKMWRWDVDFMGKSENQTAFTRVAATAAAHAAKPCVKPL
jgi:hypothetical protein